MGTSLADPVRIERGLQERHRDAAAAIYWEAFAGKLGVALGPRARAIPFLASAANPRFALSAMAGDAIVGIAGFKTVDGAFLDGSFADLRRAYGALSALWRAGLLALLEREAMPGTLLMDGIAVSAEARGRGIGRSLLAAVVDEARRRGMERVRLDVIDTNPRARALYLSCGFDPAGARSLGPLGRLYGFARVETMVRPIDPA